MSADQIDFGFQAGTGSATSRMEAWLALAGGDPITVTNEAATLNLAATGALTKMTTALDRHFGRSTNRKGH